MICPAPFDALSDGAVVPPCPAGARRRVHAGPGGRSYTDTLAAVLSGTGLREPLSRTALRALRLETGAWPGGRRVWGHRRRTYGNFFDPAA
jgi:hypothetical protein